MQPKAEQGTSFLGLIHDFEVYLKDHDRTVDHKFALPGFKDASKSASPILTLENMPKLEG